jgi:hypothetical protein
MAVAYNPDGKTVLTGGHGVATQLWDAATGRPIGSPLHRRGTIWAVAFSPDGESILIGSGEGTTRLLRIPPGLPDDLGRAITWVEVVTGLMLDEKDSVQALDNAAWLARRERLEQQVWPALGEIEPLAPPLSFPGGPPPGPRPGTRSREKTSR